MAFSFEKLDVYAKAVELALKVELLCKDLKGKASYSLLDQLNRATVSIALNIAEGNGRWHKKEKKNFFWIARGSVFEIIPIMQILRGNNYLEQIAYADFYERLENLSKMLFKLIGSVDSLNQI